ncbi:hypothetical protein DY000_02035875 [Brassica cretica]|uniref:Uncharacterized protein n=1 Tax=Brassica cretica TaxID=69181 RepID=A0ABQ7DXT5_BRACR|nr:hypothetical protein DY000_02035875 [Brassica cretica]
MDALGGFWGLNGFNHRRKKNNSSGDRRNQRKSGSSDSVDVSRDAAGYQFPLKQAVTAGALTFTGDTIAQLSGRWKKRAAALKQSSSSDKPDQEELWNIFSEHDWVRALRMSTYGVVPLQARVAFMSMGSVFWNFYLSSTLSN